MREHEKKVYCLPYYQGRDNAFLSRNKGGRGGVDEVGQRGETMQSRTNRAPRKKGKPAKFDCRGRERLIGERWGKAPGKKKWG